jgi:hypothetical protein
MISITNLQSLALAQLQQLYHKASSHMTIIILILENAGSAAGLSQRDFETLQAQTQLFAQLLAQLKNNTHQLLPVYAK